MALMGGGQLSIDNPGNRPGYRYSLTSGAGGGPTGRKGNNYALRQRYLRPSKHASGGDIWTGHFTRWGDDKRQPMPVTRGIPFSGDRGGGWRYRAANISPTGF